ncbi:dihydrouridine synthase-domain-containing protein [Lipomyces japonicus]|uniref:dihydrouridine synthase-domain-containing protein n=1 Tax=Lipomyces japonicus TaxID=56871 RepID=UPI0034CD69AE
MSISSIASNDSSSTPRRQQWFIDDGSGNPDQGRQNILELFARARKEGKVVRIAAPMVRYSRLPFRLLVKEFGCDLTYTPMMIAREFKNSPHARRADFSTCADEGPVIAQFGASNASDLVEAVKLVRGYVSGVGINCGCPIKEQNAIGIGAALMKKLPTVVGMVTALRQNFGTDLVVDVKIRIHKNTDETVEFARAVAEAGANIITVHGRQHKQRNASKPDLQAIRKVRQGVPANVYVVANGDCFNESDVSMMHELTGCDGVMAARGLLTNPALFSGYQRTPWRAVELAWALVDEFTAARQAALPFRNFQYMLAEMTAYLLTKDERAELREFKTWDELQAWVDARFYLARAGDPGFAQRDYEGYRR